MSLRFHLVAAAALSLAACQSVHTQVATPTPTSSSLGQPHAPGTPPALNQPVSLALTPGATPPPATPKPASQQISYSSVHGVGRTIAMTFDDGPSPKLTPMLLDMLKQRGIHATFFLVGQNAAEYPDIVRRTVAEGHEIGNHSWSHPQLTHLSLGGVDSQIQKTNEAIHNAVGYYPKLMRPPYGATSIALNKHYAQTYGMKVILWSVDPLDWKYRNSARVEREILSQVGPGGIILSHDIHATTVAAMPETLDALIAKGYKFVTVSELIAMQGSVATPTPTPASTPVPAKKKKSLKSTTVTVPMQSGDQPPTPPPADATPIEAATEGSAAQ